MDTRASGCVYLVLLLLLAEFFSPQQCFVFGEKKESASATHGGSWQHSWKLGGGAGAGGSIDLGGGAAAGGSLGLGGSPAAGGSLGLGGDATHGGSWQHSWKLGGGSWKLGGGAAAGGSLGMGGSAGAGGSLGLGGGATAGSSLGLGGGAAAGGSLGLGGGSAELKGSKSVKTGKASKKGKASKHGKHAKGKHSGEVKSSILAKGKHSGEMKHGKHAKGKHSGESKHGKHAKGKGKSKEAKSKEIITTTKRTTPAPKTTTTPVPTTTTTMSSPAPTRSKLMPQHTTIMEGLPPALTATTSSTMAIPEFFLNLLVIYDGEKFEKEFVSISEDTPALGAWDNMCSSVIVYGPALWQVFELPNYMGRSVVLEPGEYSTTDLLPFGNNQLSSARMVFSVDVPRTDITGVGPIVCFERQVNHNYVWGLISRAAIEASISVFHFGFMGDDIDACEQACRNEPRCAAYTLFLGSYQDSDLVGNCYGRSFHESTDVYEENCVGGVVATADKEDTITVFDGLDFDGPFTTIASNMNISSPVICRSIIVTGKDMWYIKIETGPSSYSVINLTPGEYPDVTGYIPDGTTIVSITKTDPMSIVQKHDLQVDLNLAPDAFKQIADKLPETKPELDKVENECTTTQEAEIVFVIDRSGSIGSKNFKKVLQFVSNVTDSFDIAQTKVRVGAVAFSTNSYLQFKLEEFSDKTSLQERIAKIKYTKGWTYTHKALEMLRTQVLNDENTRPGKPKVAIVVTDGESTSPNKTDEEAHLVRDDGIALTAVGIKGADYDELLKMTGDKSRVFNIDDFDNLNEIVESVKKTTCKVVKQQVVAEQKSQHTAVTLVQGDDEHYFFHEIPQYKRLPDPLGLESGVVIDAQIFASSSKDKQAAYKARLNHVGGWMPVGSIKKNLGHYIEVDFGTILPIHGVGTQGHSEKEHWVTKYKLATSLDGITYVTLRDKTNKTDLVFIGNVDQNTVKHHCLHRLFGDPIKARVVRIIPIVWHTKIGLRFEVYGFRDLGDAHLLEALKKDVWTRNVTGCPCYHNPMRKDCGCCEEGGCQCGGRERHQCVQCGYPHNCGTVSLRDPNHNVDGWTRSQRGCRCMFDLKSNRMDCACCQNGGCQCGERNLNQCVNCAHPQHCGLKEHIFGPNSYCVPKNCIMNGQA